MALQHINTRQLFVKLCWQMSTYGVSADHVANIDETSCRLLPVHQIGWGCGGVKQPQLQGSTREATTFTVAFSMDRGPRDMLVHIVRGQDRRRLAGAVLAGAHSSRHVRERLGHQDDALAAHERPGRRAEPWQGQAWILRVSDRVKHFLPGPMMA